jgi:uncharacterized protein YndB with AHSA1/START domain
MNNKLIVRSIINIDSTFEKVWDVLTNPNITPRYMFGCEALSDWNVGSQLNWTANVSGENIVYVKGVIKHISKPEKLVYTVIDPQSSMEDIPSNYLDVEYFLSIVNGSIQLVVTQSGFEDAADGIKRYNEVYNNGEGWNPILEQIKSISEEI